MIIEKVMIDLDGVNADFKKGAVEMLTEYCHLNLTDYESAESMLLENKSRFWKAMGSYDANVKEYFYSLDKLPDADYLFSALLERFPIEQIEILTATGYTPKNAADQKIRWVRENISDTIVVNTVRKAADKAQFASVTTLLIDDSTKATQPFLEAGGHVILHTSAKTTIEMLDKLLM